MNTDAPAAPGLPGEFARRMNGTLVGMLHWDQLDALWQRLRARPQGWYLCQPGEAAPTGPLDAAQLHRFVTELDALLRREHRQAYCGIVYADRPDEPELIKIYDPANLGSACSCSATPIQPRWVLSRLAPERFGGQAAAPETRPRWWKRLFGADPAAATSATAAAATGPTKRS